MALTLAHEIGKIQLLPKHLKRTLQSHLFFAEDALKEDSGLFAPRWQMDDLQQDTRIFQSKFRSRRSQNSTATSAA